MEPGISIVGMRVVHQAHFAEIPATLPTKVVEIPQRDLHAIENFPVGTRFINFTDHVEITVRLPDGTIRIQGTDYVNTEVVYIHRIGEDRITNLSGIGTLGEKVEVHPWLQGAVEAFVVHAT